MKIEININRNRLTRLQENDLLDELNLLAEDKLRNILEGEIHDFEVGEEGFDGGVVSCSIKLNKEGK
tara:strand:+ start:866 stop:1066 length:201 start_codon:yes stop_codon:yes gene_type:complete